MWPDGLRANKSRYLTPYRGISYKYSFFFYLWLVWFGSTARVVKLTQDSSIQIRSMISPHSVQIKELKQKGFDVKWTEFGRNFSQIAKILLLLF